MKEMKRILALVLCFVMLVGMMPAIAFEAKAAEETVSTIIAMSDYQNGSLSSEGKKTVPQTIVSAMVNAGITPELALLGGDYTDGSVGADGDNQSQASLKTELGNLTGILTTAWSGLPYYAIQGNHDYSGFLTDGTLSATGAYEQDNYIVYLINEDEFPWWQGNYGSDPGTTTAQDKETVTDTANALSTYLEGLDGSKPVIIMTHVPLHWTTRSTNTQWYYDNIYANVLFDAVNEAAKELDILVLFGHNHSSDYDYEIGGALAYVAKGESMKVPNGTDGNINYTEKTLNFTYMNAGYVGNYAGSTDNCSISAITIDSDSIDIDRYTYSGTVVEKSIALTGGSGSNTENSGTVTNDWVLIPGSEASTGGYQQVTDLTTLSANEKYLVVVWRYFGNNPNEEGYVFHDENNGDIKVATSDGYATVAASNGTIDNGCYWYITNNGNGTISMKNAGTGYYLGSNIVANSSSAVNLNVSTATYSGYYNMSIGYNDGAIRYSNTSGSFSYSGNTTSSGASSANACNITIYKAAAASEGSPDSYARLTGATVQNYDAGANTSVAAVLANLTIETSADGITADETTVAVTSDMVSWSKSFNGSSIGTYVGTINYQGQTLGTVTVNVTGTADEVTGEGEWIKVASGETTYVYTQATSIEAGEEYVIVANGDTIALMDNNGTMDKQTVTIDGSTMTSTTALTEWTFSGSSSGTIYNGNRYLRYSSSGWNSGFNLSTSRSTLTFTDNGSNFRIQSGNYSFYYNGSSWTRSSSTQYVRLYQYDKTETSDETYARLTGTVEQVYSNADKASVSTVLSKVSIQTSTDQSTVASTVAVTADMVTWDTEFNGSVAGVYTGTVTYENKTLGTIKVTVLPVSVEKIELVTAEGSVPRGVNAASITGGTIRVTYSDGTTELKDVTLGMLNNNAREVGTYPGLTVTYGGKTVTGFTLTVTAKAGNNYPEYPQEGHVKVSKTGTGIQFQSTGIAQVEVSAFGIPMNQGIDVVVVLDTSSSMQETVEGFSSNRLTILRPAVNSLIEQLQTKREDGSDPDLDISIVCFNGFTGNGNADTMYGSDNYIQVQAYATPNSGGLLTDKSGDGWVNIMDLATNWADEDQGNIATGSGTNYDEGLLLAYEQLAAKQASWENGETRQQFVIFMSDGAPFQYNGVYSNYTSTEWNNWLLGNYNMTDASTDNDIPDTVTNTEYYTGYTGGQGQKHRIAEAIKGDTNEYYNIVTTTADTNGSSKMESVPGLGATMYAIGYLLADNGQVTNETQDIVLKSIASNEDLYFDVDTADELDGAFTQFASDVLMAAYDARYVDQMGDNYNLQIKPFEDLNGDPVLGSDGKQMQPKIEILSYEVYTKVEADASDAITADMIGDRKSTTPTVLETITFNDDGTEAYSDKASVGPDGEAIAAGGNILIGGVIYAKNFWYNTNATSVEITGVDIPTGKDSADLTTGSTNVLPSETFYWKLGTLQNTELALRYYVYLEGSMEGTREAGSYPTNEYATLYYDNYLENPCYKDTVSPVLAWEAANVSYAFYLVNEKGEIIVNQTTGATGNFANKIAVTNPVVYKEVLLNNTGNVESIEVASLGVLPAGYELYDSASVYTIQINSNATGSWSIAKGTDTVASTYVTQYDPSNAAAYTNELTKNSDADFTHTVVWFAVLWKVQALPDTVVIDYGLPVDISVLTNDMFGEAGKLAGVGAYTADIEEITADEAMRDGFGDTYTGTYGTAKADTANGKVRYTPNTMEMKGYDKFAYAVNYTGTTNPGYYYDTVTVIPATTIYYEDNFVTTKSYTWVDGWTEVASEDENWVWTQIGTVNGVQEEDRPGQYSLTDANNIYGYDDVNLNMSKYSLDNALKATVDYDNYGTVSFTFWGTGFDVISMTSNMTGMVFVDVERLDATQDKLTYAVDTYYGYTQDADGNWVVDPDSTDSLWQIPIIKVVDLAYGQYKVTIEASYDPAYDHVTPSTDVAVGNYDFYLDAIRIYDPANDGAEDNDTVIEDAYVADGEGWPSYFELRNKILAASSFDNVANDKLTDGMEGLVFIDGDASVGDAQIEDYASFGPNNEVYLAPGQRVAFLLSDVTKDGKSIVDQIHIGIKSADGQTGTYTITNIARNSNTETGVEAGDYYGAKTSTINTTTDMYYDITGYKGDIIVISNTGNLYNTTGIISLTNIKATYTENPNGTAVASEGDQNEGISVASVIEQSNGISLLSTAAETEPVETETVETASNEVYAYMTPAAATLTLRSLNTPEVTEPETTVPEETESETTVPEETEPETTVPEETEPETTVPEETEPETTVPEETEPETTVPEETEPSAEEEIKTIIKEIIDLIGGWFGKWF